jgi:HD-like signal output (HDOD) protein/GGDEF domain-containing protein
MNPDVLEKVLACQTLPSLPAVALRVIELTNSDAVSVKDLTDAIANDQGLSAKLLKTVNSSFYGLRQRCSSINQAIVLLGLSAIKTLALGFSLVSAIDAAKGKGFDFSTYWRRGLYTGISAKLVAKHMGIQNQEEAFLGGLLQDVGMVALHQALGDDYLRLVANAGDDHRKLGKFESAELETTHADIGALLARKWKLPDELVMPIKFHEKPTTAPQGVMGVCKAVALGNFACDVLTAAEPAGPLSRYYEKAQSWAGMSNGDADNVVTASAGAAKELARLLQLDAAGVGDPAQILGKAREQLLGMSPISADEPSSKTPSGLADTTAFNRVLIAAFEQAKAGASPLCVAALYLDQYDACKQRYSANVAQNVVSAGAGVLLEALRPSGALVFDAGEGKFFALLVKCDRLSAAKAADAVRKAFAGAPLRLGPEAGAVREFATTVSVGAGVMEPSTAKFVPGSERLVQLAEQCLGAAKSAGAGSIKLAVPSAAAA